MTTATDLIELAREVVALPGWRWMPGMRATIDGAPGTVVVRRGSVYTAGNAATWWAADIGAGEPWPAEDAECLPDLADPATLGCLLALVREAWGDPTAHVIPVQVDDESAPPKWAVVVAGLRRDFMGPTEAHALVAALRAAGAR